MSKSVSQWSVAGWCLQPQVLLENRLRLRLPQAMVEEAEIKRICQPETALARTGDQLDKPNQDHIGDDNKESGVDDATGSGAADAFGAAAGVHARVAAGHSDQESENDRFQDGRHHVFQP